MAVLSHDDDVDPVGACVGMNGTRVNAVVQELHNEKIDIICWDENPARLIENALSPAKVISVIADSDEKTASVIVPDYQLSLAIRREGQNVVLLPDLPDLRLISNLKHRQESLEISQDLVKSIMMKKNTMMKENPQTVTNKKIIKNV